MKAKYFFGILLVWLLGVTSYGKFLPSDGDDSGDVDEEQIASVRDHIENGRPFDLYDRKIGNFSEKKIIFYLYTRKNPDVPIELKYNNIGGINKKHHTKLIIHGWLENATVPWCLEAKNEYLQKGEHNVIIVDWKEPANKGYLYSSKHSIQLGDIVGKFISNLGVSFKKLHLIGHSLGAHAAGFAGKVIIRNNIWRKLERITALDPSGPSFPFNEPNDRLDKGDANMVDVLHTDGARYGMEEPIGTVDFFPNGGKRHQPGCPKPGDFRREFCSHRRSYAYYVESIRSSEFVATYCTDWSSYEQGLCKYGKTVVYGDSTPSSVKGNYFFRTNAEKPYGQGSYKMN